MHPDLQSELERFPTSKPSEISLILLQDLDPRERRLLILRHAVRLDPTEIAIVMDESVDQVLEGLEVIEDHARRLAASMSTDVEPVLSAS
jgi:DNA-directed RNA polymerase specialized sigma24 family protein